MMQRIGLVSFLALACGCASTPDAEPAFHAAPAPAPAAQPVMQVVPLKFAPAEELSKVIVQALGASHRKGFRVVADTRTNSVILTGDTDADIAAALELISRLDVEATKSEAPKAEAPKAEAPKADAPKEGSEAPKAQ